MLRANSSIDSSLEHLKVSVTDWANWDDAYDYIRGNNSVFADENLSDVSLVNLNIDLMTFVDAQGEVVYTDVIDIQTESAIASENITNQIMTYSQLFNNKNTQIATSGIVRLDEGLMLVVAKSILNTQKDQPAMGTLIFGRFIDDVKISEFENITQLPITIYILNSESLPENIKLVQADLNTGHDSYITHTNFNEEAIYDFIKDIDNKPVAILQIVKPRNIYQNGVKTIIVFILATYVTILITLLVMSLVSKKILGSRFNTLTEQVEIISQTKDISLRINEGRPDEIGRFAAVFNSLLDGLSKAHANEVKLQKQDDETSVKLQERIVEIEKFNKIMIDREMKVIELKNRIKELENPNGK
ncbi:MAG: hypothetical protein RLZZ230_171 [Candidatus Parcubacteria bacterium]